MFGSTILDVALGLVFLFLAVSLAASAITEGISSALKLRHTTLRDGVGQLLNDPNFTGTALALYNHALVNPLARGTATRLTDLKTLPAYIPSRNFALALLHILERLPAAPPVAPAQPAAGPGQAVPAQAGADPVQAAPAPTLAALVAKVQNEQLRQALTTLLRHADDDRDAFVQAIGEWFDGAMDRVSGWYKRYAQLIGAIVAFIICVILNADALRIGAVLWRTPTLADELKLTDADQVTKAIDALDKAGLLGWSAGNYNAHGAGILLMILGWLIVTGASLFGAPFWFDTLQRFVQLGGTGPDTTGKKGA